MRVSRRLHTPTLLNTGYNLAIRKMMKFVRFILWDMSGAVKSEDQESTHISGLQGTESPDGARGVPALITSTKQAVGLQK
jgi:hypothetical protein